MLDSLMRVVTVFLAVVSSVGIVGPAGVLDEIPSTTENPPTEYRREDDFGKAWLDVDGNYCDTRNDVLGLQLTDIEYVPVDEAPSRCRRATVATGILDDPYTGQSIEFTRENPAAVQIDHIVPLSWAWQNGAWKWTQEERIAFANDPENLLAVDGTTNQSKGNKGPSQWLPANESFRCEYVERFTTMVGTHDLSLPDDDRASLTSLLTDCGSSADPSIDPSDQGRDTSTNATDSATSESAATKPATTKPAATESMTTESERGTTTKPSARAQNAAAKGDASESNDESIHGAIGVAILVLAAISAVLRYTAKRANGSKRRPRR